MQIARRTNSYSAKEAIKDGLAERFESSKLAILFRVLSREWLISAFVNVSGIEGFGAYLRDFLGAREQLERLRQSWRH